MVDGDWLRVGSLCNGAAVTVNKRGVQLLTPETDELAFARRIGLLLARLRKKKKKPSPSAHQLFTASLLFNQIAPPLFFLPVTASALLAHLSPVFRLVKVGK